MMDPATLDLCDVLEEEHRELLRVDGYSADISNIYKAQVERCQEAIEAAEERVRSAVGPERDAAEAELDAARQQKEAADRERMTAIVQQMGAVNRSALCISGGGIRSATFALGAIQAMARHGVLSKFHYLSTVSGGGYIGSWLSAWTTHIA